MDKYVQRNGISSKIYHQEFIVLKKEEHTFDIKAKQLYFLNRI